MKRAVRLLVVHHNRLFRECLVSVLADVACFHVDEVDHTCGTFWRHIESSSPDVLLVGSNLPDDPACLIRHVRQNVGETKVLLLASPGRENVVECVAAGAHGCVQEQCSVAELHEAIEKTLDGEVYCSAGLLRVMFERLSRAVEPSCWQGRMKTAGLTPRELEIIHLIAGHLSNKEIARRLSVSIYTVKNHVHNIIDKLNVEDRFEAVEYAQRHHLLDAGRPCGAAESMN